MTPDSLRALLDAAGRPYPSSAHEPWPRWQDASHIAVRRDDIASLARIALAAVELAAVRPFTSTTPASYEEWVGTIVDRRKALADALRDAGLLAPAPQEPQL